MPQRFVVRSTYDFITLLNGSGATGKLASLDVESLFTNVPVHETIDIIINNVYNHPTLPAPKIPSETLRELLVVCTTKTPFQHINGDLYVQSEGVSMGSCLGPTFADYYMCHVENMVFDEFPALKPTLYARYVDDCFLLVQDYELLQRIKNKFEQVSVLKFTYEIEESCKLPFLDVLVSRHNELFRTCVYTKDTNYGDCINYRSLCPENYKIGVIKTLLHRGYAVSSDWSTFHTEIQRIKQLLTNNNFPMDIIDKTVNKFVNSRVNRPPHDTKAEMIELYFENQMTSNYKVEERQLQDIIRKHVQTTNESKYLKLSIFYKNRKLKNLLIKNKPAISNDHTRRHHVVYLYTCDQEGCNSLHQYVGYTSCTLHERFKMHTQNGSIIKHIRETHNISKIPRKSLLAATTILRHCPQKRNLIMTEAVLIKELKPNLNSQEEGCDRLLKIFKH